jgi:PII-like signaling protein
MLSPGLARKVSVLLNEDTVADRDFLAREIFSFLFAQGVAGATLLRPQAGFGSHHRVHQANGDPSTREHLPILIEFVETVQKVDALMPGLCNLVTDGLIEAHDTTVIQAAVRKDPA